MVLHATFYANVISYTFILQRKHRIGVVVVKGVDFVVSCSKHQHCQIVLGFFLNQKNVLVGVKQLRLIENCLYDFDNSCIYFGVVVLQLSRTVNPALTATSLNATT